MIERFYTSVLPAALQWMLCRYITLQKANVKSGFLLFCTLFRGLVSRALGISRKNQERAWQPKICARPPSTPSPLVLLVSRATALFHPGENHRMQLTLGIDSAIASAQRLFRDPSEIRGRHFLQGRLQGGRDKSFRSDWILYCI